jgi:hypothetical protein
MFTPFRTVSAAAAAALATAVAIPTLTSAQTTGARDITVRDKVRSVQFVHVKPSDRGEHLGRGDRVITSQRLFNENNDAVGTLSTDCVNVGAPAQVFKATLQCTSTYQVKDGEVVTAGVVVLSAGSATRFPIVGGSGAYRGAHGEVSPGAPVKGYDSVDALHLDG